MKRFFFYALPWFIFGGWFVATGGMIPPTLPAGGSSGGYADIMPTADGVIFARARLSPEQATAMDSNNRCFIQPLWLNSGSAVKLRVNVTVAATAGSICKFVLYKCAANGTPGTYLGQSANMAADTTGLKEAQVTPAAAIAPGPYWCGFVCNGTPTLNVYTNSPQGSMGDHFNDCEGGLRAYFALTMPATPTDNPALTNDLAANSLVMGATMVP